MVVKTSLWDTAYIVKQEQEEPTIPPADALILYAISQEPEFADEHQSQATPIYTPVPIIGSPPYPPPIIPATRFRLPLPRDTNPNLNIEVRVKGQLGLQLSRCCSIIDEVNHGHLLSSILHWVDDASTPMNHFVYGQYVWVERAYFPNEKVRREAHAIPKDRHLSTFTRAHLIALMIEAQHRHWSDLSTLWGEVELEPLITAIWAKGSRITWDDLYIVAIRRRQSRSPDGSYRWFPALELHVTA